MILGLDSETVNGYARLVAVEDGRIFRVRTAQDAADVFRALKGSDYIAYNADYDVQALLKYMPAEDLRDVVKGITVKFEGITLTYIPTKFLRFGPNYIFDAYHFFNSKLETAAQKFLGRGKAPVDASKISEENIYSPEVEAYCVEDARLVGDLFRYFEAGLPSYLQGTKPISPAHYSFKYFQKELEENRPRPAISDEFRRAYGGGRFEVLKRGHWTNVWNYDINAAYPYEIQRLRGLKRIAVMPSPEYLASASFSLYKVNVDIPDLYVSPIMDRINNVCIFPTGKFSGYVTKSEFEEIQRFDPEIEWAIHLYGDPEYPFRDKMIRLYEERKKAKNNQAIKVIMNSTYGKTAQVLEKFSTEIPEAGALEIYESHGKLYFKYEDSLRSNFVYATEITARPRLRLYRIMRDFPDKVIAVQTDSILATDPLDLPVSPALGDWKAEKWDEVFMLGSGVYFYRIGPAWFARFRGFNFAGEWAKEKLDQILNSDRTAVSFDVKKHYSIKEAIRLDAEDLMNLIVEVSKSIDINFDKKRIWAGSWRSGSEILTKNLDSRPISRSNGQLELFGGKNVTVQ